MAIDKINHYSMTNPASVYDEEALTALELAARTGKKLNEVIEDQNALRVTTEKTLEDQNKTLEKFEKVTIPSEVKETVLEHINEGDFDDQISAHLDGLNERVDNMLGSMTEGSTTMDAEIIDARTDPTGKAHVNLGERIRDREETVPFPKVAELEKADFLVNWSGLRTSVLGVSGSEYRSKYDSPSKVDMKYFTPGTIVFGNNLTVDDFTDLPDAVRYSNHPPTYMIVEGYGEKQNLTWGDGTTGRFQPWIKQTLVVDIEFQRATWHRYLQFIDGACWWDTSLWIDGEGAYGIYDGSAEKVQRMVDHTVDVTSVIVGVGGVNPIPENGWLLTVERVSAGWIIQKAYGLHNNAKQFYRIGSNKSVLPHKEYWAGDDGSYNESGTVWSEWKQVADVKMIEEMIKAIPSGGGSGAPLPWTGKTIVFLGDSICGNFRDASGVCVQVEKLTGATVKNFCFGGTRIARRYDGSAYDTQDLSSLVEFIGGGNLEETIASTGEEPQHYWREVAHEFDAFDFSTVDLFVIVSGTNDYFSTFGNDSYDIDEGAGEGTVISALGDVINKLQTTGKGRVLYVAPNYRNDLEESYKPEVDYMDNVVEFGTLGDMYTLEEANKQLEQRCSVSGIPCLNPLYELGINRANWSHFGEDTVHLNAEGRLVFARFIAGKINQM